MKNFFTKKFSFLTLIVVVIFGLGAVPLFAVTDSVSVGLEVTGTTTPPDDDDDGGGGSISGCTNSSAINYNPNATIDNGSCIYPTTNVPNVTDFVARYQESNNTVDLSWVNPVFANFQAVRLVRRLGAVPISPNEGVLIYEGVGQAVVDTSVVANQTYYYTIFVRSNTGAYSSGVITFAVTSADDTVVPPDDDPPDEDPSDDNDDGEDGGDGGGPSDNDPFVNFPEVQTNDPVVSQLNLGDFIFVQPRTSRQIFTFGSRIRLSADQPTTVYLPYDKVPRVLKAIGVTIVDPDDSSKVFSFLLQANADQTAYTATIGPLGKQGTYPVFIYIINYQDQTIKQITGTLEVSGLPFVSSEWWKNLLPVGGTLGLVTGVVGLAGVFSFFEFYLLILRALAWLFGFFGVRKQIKSWGTVYDSVTKQPIDPAYVVVHPSNDMSKEVATAITDIDGRYGFLLPRGAYRLEANKTHYVFPSRLLAGKKSDELYDNLYFGDPFLTDEGDVVNLNVPLDPVGFDWNEFAKQHSTFFQIYSNRELRRLRIIRIITIVGFISTVLAVVFTPGWLNIGVLGLYLILFVVQAWWRFHHRVVSVKQGLTGRPVPFAIIRAFYTDLGQEAKHVVADSFGRFYILLRPGEYYFTIETRGADGVYTKVHQTENLSLPKGVLTKDIAF